MSETSKTMATMKLCRVDNELLTCDANHPHLARRCLAPASHYALRARRGAGIREA
jgi:hypothetical protein